MTDFQSFNLNEKILQAITNKGYSNPTPIQEKAIVHIIAGEDFLGIAQTGTGKTAAFALPTLHLLYQRQEKPRPNCARALVLTPTRELASQVAQCFTTYGQNLHFKFALVYGGVSDASQIKSMSGGVDVLIATPGRLIDLAEQKHIDFSQIEIFILDEADRMLDMGFIDDIKKIINKLPKERQTLFFSATMPAAIENLANSILNNPTKVEITPQSTTVEKIEQTVHIVSKSDKAAALINLLKKDDIKSTLVFCQMKHSANRLSQFLEREGIRNVVLHGNKSQNARESALKAFRSGNCKILIATDIAARGIDIPEISHVINYDLPRDIENYVHRIGRTARAGRDGVAISLCDATELKSLRQIEKSIGMKIKIDESENLIENNVSNTPRMTGVRISRGSSNATSQSSEPSAKHTGSAPTQIGRRISSGNSSKNRIVSSNYPDDDYSKDERGRERRLSDNDRDHKESSNRHGNHSNYNSSNKRQSSDKSFKENKKGSLRRESFDKDSEVRSKSANHRKEKWNKISDQKEEKIGILQRIFGGWKKKDARSNMEEMVTKRFTNKNSPEGHSDKTSSREPNYAKKRPFFSKTRQSTNHRNRTSK